MLICRKCKRLKPANQFPPLYGRAKTSHCFACLRQREADYKKTYGMSQSKAHNIRKRFQVLRHYSCGDPKCSCCGETSYEFLGIDHIKGGGRKHTSEIGSGKLYNWLVKHGFPEGFRVLCHNCNQAIGLYGYCPHQHPELALKGPPPLYTRLARDDRDDVFVASAKRLIRQLGRQPSLPELAAFTGSNISSCFKRRRRLRQEGRWPNKLE